MAVVMCQTRKVLNPVAPDDAAATGTRARLTSSSRHFHRPDGHPAVRRPHPPSCPAHRSGARRPAH
jgi:hypothetical protein